MAIPRRPRPLADRARLRLGMRLAAGMAPARVARVEGLPEAALDALLAKPAFARLVRDYRDLARLGREERLARLELLAFDVLEDAIAAGDTRVILWFLTERHAGRDPVRRVAEAVVRQAERAGAAPTRARGASPATAGTPATCWPARRPPAPPPRRRRSPPRSWPGSRAGRAAPPPSAAASGRCYSHPCRPPARPGGLPAGPRPARRW